MAFTVFTDTAGNLPKRLADSHDLKVIPLIYRIGGKEYTCMDVEQFDGGDFYRRMREGEEVTTSQITPQTCIEQFEPFLKEGQDILYISMASGISGTYNSVNVASDMLSESYPDRKIIAVDSMGAALGEGFVALRAAQYRDQGMSLEETAEKMKALSTRMCNVFTVDDLMFLRRGGRLSNIAAFVGTVFGIKPLLKGSEDAKIVAFGKVRGRKKSIDALFERYTTLVEDPSSQTIGIVEADCREDAKHLAKLIRTGSKPPKDILIVGYEPVTGCHVGPGALALFFEGREDVRTALDDYPGSRRS